MVRENVIAQLANIQTHPSVRLAKEKGLVNLHGWVYDIESGSIDALALLRDTALDQEGITVAEAPG